MSLAERINQLNESMSLPLVLPDNVKVMNPFEQEEARNLARQFYLKFYNDTRQRKMILGINPGRLGAGVTGIPFTDPVKLEEKCGISNELKKVTEPSAGFIYDMIRAYGGVENFYNDFFIYAVSPLGFTKNGINYNYYDSTELEKAVSPFIIESLKKALQLNIDNSVCFCLGNGKNYKFLKNLNKMHNLFGDVIPLPHPRWIVQYRRKRYDEFINEYVRVLKD